MYKLKQRKDKKIKITTSFIYEFLEKTGTCLPFNVGDYSAHFDFSVLNGSVFEDIQCKDYLQEISCFIHLCFKHKKINKENFAISMSLSEKELRRMRDFLNKLEY